MSHRASDSDNERNPLFEGRQSLEHGCECSYSLAARVCAPLLAMLLLSPAASAEGDADAAKGIVVQHCVRCHEVPGYASEVTDPKLGAPSFATIANDPQTYDQQSLKTFLRKPHWPMQGFILSNRDIDNLLAFIESLRKE